MAIAPFPFGNRLLGPLVIALILAALLLCAVVLVRYFRASPEEGEGDGTPDTAWKAGMLYCNREDPALWVPARFGFGYTLNFGNRWAWIILVAIFVMAAVGITAAVLSGG